MKRSIPFHTHWCFRAIQSVFYQGLQIFKLFAADPANELPTPGLIIHPIAIIFDQITIASFHEVFFLVSHKGLLVSEGLATRVASKGPASSVLAFVGIQVAGLFEALVAEPARVRPLVSMLSFVPQIDAYVWENLLAHFAHNGSTATRPAF